MATPESSPVESGSSTPPTGEATRSPDDAMLARRAAAATVLGDLLIDGNRPEGQKRFDQHGDELSLENLEQLALVAPEVSRYHVLSTKMRDLLVDNTRPQGKGAFTSTVQNYPQTASFSSVGTRTL